MAWPWLTRFTSTGLGLRSADGGSRCWSHSLPSLGAQAIPADLVVLATIWNGSPAAGEVDVLVANAALPASGHLLDLSQSQIDTMLDVDLRAPIALVRALAPAMATRGRGHIVLISSLSGKAATPAASIYSAAKFGLRGFAHGARADLRGRGSECR